MAVFWTRSATQSYDRARMLAVIGNVVAGLLALSLFTATVRLSK
jgi:hypothetical protein